MTYKVLILREAQAELRREARYSVHKWGSMHARDYMRDLRTRIRNLSIDHSRFEAHAEIGAGVRIMSYKGNRVVFIVDHHHRRVMVIAVLSVYQDTSSDAIRRRLRPDI